MESPGELAPAYHGASGEIAVSVHLATSDDETSFTWEQKQSLQLIFFYIEKKGRRSRSRSQLQRVGVDRIMPISPPSPKVSMT